jgi:hypothetical protein
MQGIIRNPSLNQTFGQPINSPLVDPPQAFSPRKIESVAILTHQHDAFAETNYMLRWVAEVWKQQGIRVTVVRGLGPKVEADLAILHVDLTVVPPEYIQYMRQYPIALNGNVNDISKRKISSNLVRLGDGYKGPVIVKTNRNYGGNREAEIPRSKKFLSRCKHAIRRRLPWMYKETLGVWDYPIYQARREVPWPVWFNRDLIVEKLQSERRDGFYCLRSWIFLGDAERSLLMYANQPIIKSKVAVKIEQAEVPDELREIRRRLGFDFGKFDYGIIDGRVVLYDANRTPTIGDPKVFEPVLEKLANGIHSFA